VLENAVCFLAFGSKLAHTLGRILVKIPPSWMHVEAATAHAASPEPANEALGIVPDVTPIGMSVCAVSALATLSKAAYLSTRAFSLVHLHPQLIHKAIGKGGWPFRLYRRRRLEYLQLLLSHQQLLLGSSLQHHHRLRHRQWIAHRRPAARRRRWYSTWRRWWHHATQPSRLRWRRWERWCCNWITCRTHFSQASGNCLLEALSKGGATRLGRWRRWCSSWRRWRSSWRRRRDEGAGSVP